MLDYFAGFVIGVLLCLIVAWHTKRGEIRRQMDIVKKRRRLESVPRHRAIITQPREEGAETVLIRAGRFPKKVQRNF